MILIAFLFWAFSYLFTWLMKITLASIVLQTNCFYEFYANAEYRMGFGEFNKVTGLNLIATTISRNLLVDPLATFILFSAVILLLIELLTLALKNRGSLRHYEAAIFCLLFCAVCPFLWYAVIANHSFIHAWFAYRNLILSLSSIGLLCILLIKADAETKRAV